MTTRKQRAANIRNAQRSTGPQTVHGKGISAMNARKHGLFSSGGLLADEDPVEFEEWAAALRLTLHPEDALQSELADDIVWGLHRLRRLRRMETGILDWRYHGIRAERAETEAAKYSRFTSGLLPVPNLEEPRPKIEISDPEKHQQALADQKQYQAAQQTDLATLGEAFVRDSARENALLKLAQIGRSITRDLHRSLNELRQLQGARYREPAAPAPPLDIDV
jgi:hypothetical protein